jgi:penicillin-insensitive murein endopeptidase
MTSMLRAALALTAAALMGCAQLGVVSDGTSVSWGPANRGLLIGAQRLPLEGEGYVVLATWAGRGTQWGIGELIDVIAWTARAVARTHPGSVLSVGDLSIEGGGHTAHHRSHRTGRDVDFVLFSRKGGAPQPAIAMKRFRADGTLAEDPTVTFDTERQWTVVRGLLTAPGPGIANIFLYAPLREQLLDHARAIGEPEALVDLAAATITQPGDSAPHDDHMHVRIYCPRGEPTCRDYALRPAAKKPPSAGAFPEVARAVGRRPITGGILRVRPRW